MLPLLAPLFPVAIIAVRQKVKNSVENGIAKGSEKAHFKVIQQISTFIISNLIIACINIFFIIAFSVLFILFELEWIKFSLCSFYASSVLYTFYSFIINFNSIKKLLFKYKLNFKAFLQDEIEDQAREEASEEIDNLGFFSSVANKLFGKSAYEIASEVKERTIISVWPRIIMKIISFIIVFLLYVAVFRLFVAPILIKEATELNTVEAFFYPFFYSFKYFLSLMF